MRVQCIAVLPAVILAFALPAMPQNNTGIISGRITDPTGAVVPNAHIKLIQTATNVEWESQSNTDGLFRIPGLPDGPYKIVVTASGFKNYAREGFSLRIGENLELDTKLEVGAAVETITVKASTALLDTQTSSTGQVMEGDYFYKLPNYQHWEKGVLYYTPQVETSNAPWPGSLGNWNFNGANSYQTAQYEDGQLATSMDGGTTVNSVSVGDEEVKVISSAMPAEFGHATSGALLVVKKGGTNEFHGEGGELFKNNPLVQRRFFQLQTNPQQNVSDLFQMPDFVLSGPVIIPKVYNGRNKTFFSVAGSYHVDSSSNASSYTTPTPAMLAGDFSAYSNILYDPASTSGSFAAGNLQRTPFPGNIIPQNRFSTMWTAIAANKPFAAPMAGVGSVTSTGPVGNIVASGTGNYFNLTNQVRLDHSFTEKIKMNVSYWWGNQHQPQNNANITYAPYDQYQLLTYTVQNTAHLGVTYAISATLISEFSVGEYRRTGNPQPRNGENYEFALTKTIPNLPSNVYVNPINFGLTEGTNGSSQLGVGTLSVAVNNNHQLKEDVTKIWRTHSFKMGYEWLWQNYISHNIGNPRLSLTFADANGIGPTGITTPNTGGVTLADIELGYISSYSYNQQGASLLPVDSNQALYFQDDWRILPNLTLNVGVRYQNETPAHSKFPGQLSNGSLTVADNYYTSGSVPGLLTCPSGGCVGGWVQPKGFVWNRQNDNFQPRFGLAWTVEPNTVIRGGFGLMTLDWNLGYTNQNEIGGANFYNQTVSQAANVYTPLFNINQGVPAFSPPTPNALGEIPTTATTPSARPTITVYPQNYHHPYTLNWNFTVQHAVKKDYMVELSYVGLHNVGFGGTVNMDSRPYGTGIDANGNVIDLTNPVNWAYRNSWVSNSSGVNGTQAYKPFPNLGGVNLECNCVSMIYHSGTIKAEKRASHGLTFLAFFTYQKGLTTNWNSQNLYLPISVGRSVTGTTQKFRFVSSMLYELPFGKGRPFLNSSPRFVNWLAGGWSFSWNFSVWTPTPLGIGYSGGTYINPVTGALGGRQDYPSYEPEPGGGIYLLKDPQLRSDWQDIGTNRFVQTAQNPIVTNCGTTPIIQPNGATFGNLCEEVAPSFTNGNLPGNEWTSERIIGANASMYKDFKIKERFTAQIRLDYFNPFKWFNWTSFTTTMTQSTPATFMTPGLNDFGDSTEGGPSEMQLSFRVRW